MQQYTAQEVAALLSVTAKTVRKWARQRKLRSSLLGRSIRISEQQLKDYLASQVR